MLRDITNGFIGGFVGSMGGLTSGLTDLLYPPECPGCAQRKSVGLACSACTSTFRAAGRVEVTASLPERVLPVMALWVFEENEPVQRIMHQLKYANSPWIGIDIGSMLGDRLALDSSWQPDLVTAVPLHQDRQASRGYNQSEWIARGVARRFDVIFVPDVILRVKSTRSQTTLSQEERLANMEGAFAVQSDGVEGKHIALIDDTVTTGATLMACAEALAEAGALTVLPASAAAAPLRSALEPDHGFPVILS